MARELLTSWSDFQSALDRLLAVVEREIHIHDGDLARLKLDSTARLDQLKRLLPPRRQDCIRIALQETAPMRHNNPRLLTLLTSNSGSMTVLKMPDHLAALRETLILADGRHGLVLFERSQPRSKLLLDEPDEIEPYMRRFEQIWQEGGIRFTTATLGL